MGNNREKKNEFALGISLTKPHMLENGQLAWWYEMQETHIRQQDYQCWHVIENGDYVITEKDKSKWDVAEYRLLEKNAKAKQLILNGLHRCDIDKVMHIKTAKEIWAALKVIHAGSIDQQKLIKHDLLKQFMDFTMIDNEDVSTYHSRFQNLVNRMNSHKMDMEHLDQGLTFVKGADARFSTTKKIILMSPECHKLSVEELAGKFMVDQRDQAGSSSKPPKGDDHNGTALKLEKVLKAMKKNKPIKNSNDSELVLMS